MRWFDMSSRVLLSGAFWVAMSLTGVCFGQADRATPPAEPSQAGAKATSFASIWFEGQRASKNALDQDGAPRRSVREAPAFDLPPAPKTPLFRRVSKDEIFEPQAPTEPLMGRREVVTTLYNIHTREALPLVDGRAPAKEILDELTRCRGFGQRKSIDPRLLEIVLAAARHFSAAKVEIISAYRSPKFNDALSKKGRHVATRSKHMDGEAIDVTFVGSEAAEVGAWLWRNFDGGVGVYRVNNFVHLDVGPKRRWFGR